VKPAEVVVETKSETSHPPQRSIGRVVTIMRQKHVRCSALSTARKIRL